MALRLTEFSEINDLLRGSVDMHMHFGPDPLFPRRIDAAGAARDAQTGMLAIGSKSHSYRLRPLPMKPKSCLTSTSSAAFASIKKWVAVIHTRCRPADIDAKSAGCRPSPGRTHCARQQLARPGNQERRNIGAGRQRKIAA